MSCWTDACRKIHSKYQRERNEDIRVRRVRGRTKDENQNALWGHKRTSR